MTLLTSHWSQQPSTGELDERVQFTSAFELGHHADLIRDILTLPEINSHSRVLQSDAIGIIQAASWLTDYNDQAASVLQVRLAFSPQCNRCQVKKMRLLHFDSLYSHQMTMSYYRQLILNLRSTVYRIVRRQVIVKELRRPTTASMSPSAVLDTEFQLLSLLGFVLHAVSWPTHVN